MNGQAYHRWTRLVNGLLCAVAPASALRWTQGRAANLALLAHYEAATRHGPLGHKRPSRQTADALIQRDLKSVVARARDLARNNTRIQGAIREIVAQVVFGGFRPQVQFRRADGRKDTERNQRVQAHWAAWARAVDWWGLEKLILRHSWEDGNLLLRFFVDPSLLEAGIVPLGIEALEFDHLDTSVHGTLANGNLARHGIEFDALGHVAAYHLYPEHPGQDGWGLWQRSVAVPAEQVLHVWERVRASQTRGMTWLAPLVMDCYELDDYEAAVRITARLQAAMSTFLKTQNASQYMADYTGLGLQDGQDEAPAGFGLAADKGEVPETLDPGGVKLLPPGLEPHVVSSTQPGPDHEAYMRAALQGQSTGFGMTYESYSHDYAGSTYSSARNGSLGERRGYRMQQFYLLARAHGPVWQRWCRMLELSGLEPGAEAGMPVKWLLPGWPWVDPRNDATAAEKRIAMCTTSRQDIAAEAGDNFFEAADEQAEETDYLQAKGLLTRPREED